MPEPAMADGQVPLIQEQGSLTKPAMAVTFIQLVGVRQL